MAEVEPRGARLNVSPHFVYLLINVIDCGLCVCVCVSESLFQIPLEPYSLQDSMSTWIVLSPHLLIFTCCCRSHPLAD